MSPRVTSTFIVWRNIFPCWLGPAAPLWGSGFHGANYSVVGWSVFVFSDQVRFVQSAIFWTVHKEEIYPKRRGVERYQILKPKEGNHRGTGKAFLPSHLGLPQGPPFTWSERLRGNEIHWRRKRISPCVFQRQQLFVPWAFPEGARLVMEGKHSLWGWNRGSLEFPASYLRVSEPQFPQW